ncbi:hypothetical protein C8F04DRAFT_1449 [Mycena alexandri]|uniref:ADF-H domain-containing protein n=1 Tax=Mycena alexandri TaxID=1745969 RepID=A0AAD6XEQ4_9AGAR|nr:hypothetical protein C8F04DRAFT_1449 [Mycena alexandri]
MSATSGIGVSAELSAAFGRAVENPKQTRFIKVSIQNESLVHDLSVPARGSLQEDLVQLQDSDEIIQENMPAYLLTKLDDPPAEWLIIYFVPDTAKVRDKMLYASSRASLLKSLGSTLFSDSIFATSKADLTPEAYAAHRRHILAPKPLSASEQEMADVRAAERQAGGLSAYQGSRARTTHIGQTIGMPWSPDLEEAVKGLAESDDSALVVATIDLPSETLVLHSTSPTVAADVGGCLPPDGACYAFFAWKHASQRDIVFIYSCPSSCPVKHRMVYASGFNAAFLAAKALAPFHARKIETSTPSEIDEVYLRSELDVSSASGSGTPASGTSTPGGGNDDEKKPFARPRGPKRR